MNIQLWRENLREAKLMNTVNFFVGKKAQIAAEHLKEIMTTGKVFFDYL